MKTKDCVLKNVRDCLKKYFYLIQTNSLKKSAKERGLKVLIDKLNKEVPDISNQYSRFEVNNQYLKTKVRTLHAFQISLFDDVVGELENPVIVDIGDSAGTHLQYINGLYSKNKNIRSLSVNLDPEAVRRIKGKGLEAIQSRVEDLQNYNINADVFLCFETLEHLMNPCYFLYELMKKTNVKYLVVTVPYLKRSRVGLHHIRCEKGDIVQAENTHVFELSPGDWKLILRHSGWDIVKDDIFLQYPRRSLYRFTKLLWRKYDFEGFYGLILKRDWTWPSRYLDW
jgi:hypothetical protein